MIEAGTFRRDLYERLKQVPLELPPLRLRREDIAPLVSTFVERWNHRYHEEKRFEPAALGGFEAYDWPGNVRELENLVTNLCASSPENTIAEAAVSRALSSPATATGPWESGGGTRTDGQPGSDARVTLPEDGIDLRAHLTNLERALYVEALRRTDGNAERAARLLGIPGHTFRKAWRERLGGG
ncbi:MAG: hypothetical protein EA383_17240 [Spirochaetaceae bacterium]|nr:MAG: hypothetical protein EA383_17240 [Spirochaetaceae bacterium]